MSQPVRYVIENVDENDPQEMYEWAYGSCLRAPLDAIVGRLGA